MPLDLKQATSAELEAELQRRRREAVPKLRTTPNWRPLQECLAAGVESMARHSSWPQDFSSQVFEKALEAGYGPEFWSWLRQLSRY